MRTIARTGIGLFSGGAALALVLWAGALTYEAWQDRAGTAAKTRQPRDRAYAVQVDTLTPQTMTPIISAYGHLVSGRTLELRAAVGGPLVNLSPNLRDGGAVAKGDVLFGIDPAKLDAAVALAEVDLAEAQAGVAEAASALELARLEAQAVEEQRDLRAQAAARQEALRDRGVITEGEVEAARLALSAAEQTVLNRRQVVAGDEARLAQAEITRQRREIALAEARRALADATLRAPFGGVISDVTAVEGRLVSANEQLGVLMDPAALEVAFRVTNNQFSRLLNDAGDLRKAEVEVLVQRGRALTPLLARLDRAGAARAEGQIGRLVYARLIDPDPNMVQPGDFVELRIPERPLDNVAQVPATAVTADGRLLLVGAGNRLEEAQATMLRHQGDVMILTDVPFGRQYVTVRALQLGPGIQVTPSQPQTASAAAPTAAPPPDTIALDAARRAAIVAFIEASEQMKPEKRAEFLEELSRPEVPRATVERFESKMAEGQ